MIFHYKTDDVVLRAEHSFNFKADCLEGAIERRHDVTCIFFIVCFSKMLKVRDDMGNRYDFLIDGVALSVLE